MRVFFWVSASCSESMFWCLRGKYCLHLQGDLNMWTLQWYREESVTPKVKAVHYFKTSEHVANKRCKKPEDNHIILCFSLQVILTHGQREAQVAIVCVPDIGAGKTDFTHQLMQRILNPLCHGLAIICYLIIAVVYFVMPQLRDLVGNILTSISLCLITSQAADLVRIFTEFTSHVSFLVAGAFLSQQQYFMFWCHSYMLSV